MSGRRTDDRLNPPRSQRFVRWVAVDVSESAIAMDYDALLYFSY